ncbi:MAG: FtsQ-type POTRA domain-containing protein [Nitrospiraceae bacterium]|nr:MAG: FtsQ-type POTRA domain-containing protein [Nitrospiraceae bacterium]
MAVGLAAGAVLGAKMLAPEFTVKKVVVSGTYHLDRNDIIRSLEIPRGQSLTDLEFETVRGMLVKNPWIRKVSMRRQYPDTLVLKVEEATPKALLRRRNELYLIDGEGRALERIQGETIPFLPVITNISESNGKDMTEALRLVEVLSRKTDFTERESIQVGLETFGLTVTIDGELIKVGYGNYEEKFDRWMALEPEIKKRGVPVKYVDLRFKDSVIVKPDRENSEEEGETRS